MAVTTLLLDADIIAFQLAATAQRGYKWPNQDGAKSVAVDDWADQPARIDAAVEDLCGGLKTDDVIVCLSCPTEENFRLNILPTYKGNRDYSQRPEFLADVKQYMEDNYPSYRRPTLEADDIMGILSTHHSLVKGKKIIVSEDKDMKTIPGWLFNPRKGRKPTLVSHEDAEWFHLYQTLSGDTTDGYTGIPKVGDVKARALLGEMHERKYIHMHEVWPRMVELAAAKQMTEEDLLVQARVARILRAQDYNFKTKEVIPWTPM